MNNKGFTLIELLSVIVIMSVVALIATPQVMKLITDTRINATKQSKIVIERAVMTKFVQDYPHAKEGDVAIYKTDELVNNARVKEYTKIYKNSTGYEYEYLDKTDVVSNADLNRTIKSITVDGNSTLMQKDFINKYAEDLVKYYNNPNIKIEMVDGKKSLLLYNYSSWNYTPHLPLLLDSFKEKEQYTFKFNIKMFDNYNLNDPNGLSKFDFRLHIYYTDMSNTFHRISDVYTNQFTPVTVQSTLGKTIRSIGFSYGYGLNFRYAFSLDDFSIDKPLIPSTDNPFTISSLGDDKKIIFKILDKSNKEHIKTIDTSVPIYNLNIHNKKDIITIDSTNNIILTKNINKQIITNNNWYYYDSSQSSENYRAYYASVFNDRKNQTYELLCNMAPFSGNPWYSGVNKPSISGTQHPGAPQFAYLKISNRIYNNDAPYSEYIRFPNNTTATNYLKVKSFECLYEMTTPKTINLGNLGFNIRDIKEISIVNSHGVKPVINY